LPQKQDEVGDFGPSAATWRTGQNIHAMFHSGQLAPLCENMTSTTKPEVHNVLHYRQRRTSSQPHETSSEK